MWTIRFVLLGIFIVLLICSGYFLRRQKYQNFLENGVFNFVLVLCYNLLCYLLTGLPSAPGGIPVPGFFGNPASRVIFLIIGWVLFFLAILLMGTAIRQRKTLGGQNVKEGLLTGGLYRIFRHPIYTGVILASLGVALVTRSWDGLLMFPLVFLLNMVQALIEEKFDIGVRFPGQHQEYKKRTGMFGPTWVWGIVMGLLVAASLLHFG
jgi:protein-S-isoprenylcysteine O-methyltransferase Ste14